MNKDTSDYCQDIVREVQTSQGGTNLDEQYDFSEHETGGEFAHGMAGKPYSAMEDSWMMDMHANENKGDGWEDHSYDEPSYLID